MMRIWITVNTVADTALAVVGLGIAGYAISAKPAVSLLYYGVALVCVLCAIVGFCNLPVLHAAARQQEEKNARAREERGRVKTQKEAARASHEKLWRHSEEQDERLNDHETRIQVPEKARGED